MIAAEASPLWPVFLPCAQAIARAGRSWFALDEGIVAAREFVAPSIRDRSNQHCHSIAPNVTILPKGEENHEAARLHCRSDVRGRNGTGASTVDRKSLPYRIRSSHDPGCRYKSGEQRVLVIPAIFEELLRLGLGYVEGRNLLIERYSGEGRAAHYPELVRAVVSRNPD